MDKEYVDVIIAAVGENKCLVLAAELKGELFSWNQVKRRIKEVHYDDAMEGGMPVEEAIASGLVSHTKGYKDYPKH